MSTGTDPVTLPSPARIVGGLGHLPDNVILGGPGPWRTPLLLTNYAQEGGRSAASPSQWRRVRRELQVGKICRLHNDLTCAFNTAMSRKKTHVI